jgi:hypothetical protein
MNDGALFDAASIRDEEFRREVVRALDDDVHPSNEFTRVLGNETLSHEFDARSSSDAIERIPSGLELVSSDVGLGKENLPVEIGELDRVVVGEQDASGAGLRQRQRRWATEPTDADDENAPASDPRRRTRLQI